MSITQIICSVSFKGPKNTSSKKTLCEKGFETWSESITVILDQHLFSHTLFIIQKKLN